MVDAIRELFGPHYIYVKFIHLLFVMIWGWSTAVAYMWYVRIAYAEWQADPTNEYLLMRRNWVYEQFDRGAILEHIAFPVILITGPILYIAGGWGLESQWLLYKLLIVVLLFIPIEIFDYWIAHFGGNKTRHLNNEARYNHLIIKHQKFLTFISPVIVSTVLAVLFLAVVKPSF